MEFESRSEGVLSREIIWLQAWPRAKLAMGVEPEVSTMALTDTTAWLEAQAQPWVKEWESERALAGRVLVQAKARAKARAQTATKALAKAKARAAEVTARRVAQEKALMVEALRMASEDGPSPVERRARKAAARAKKAQAETKKAQAQVKEAQARAQRAEAQAKAQEEALAVAAALGQARNSVVADSWTISRILSSLHHDGIATSLWHHSPEARDEYTCIIHFIAPITRLPFELLRQIFLIVIDEATSPPSYLVLVCKHWHVIVTSIWASLNLGTRTPLSAVASKLEKSQWLLDIVVDTDSDRGDLIPSDGAFGAIFAAIEASSRWRSLVVESFPDQADLPEDVVSRRLQRCPSDTMNRFTTFKINSGCEASPLLNGLLHILGTTAGSELATVEINSANVISFLAPAYPSLFHSVKVLSLNTPGLPNPVDCLPHLHQLESFNASHISFPIYHNNVDLPLVHTLRHLRLKAVPIQWMSGRTFHVLEDCTLIFPRHRQVLHTFRATLPNCKHLTFQGYPLEVLGGLSARTLNHLSVTCPSSFNRQGDQQLLWLSHQVLGERRIAPRILHICIKGRNQAWMSALTVMSYLEELVIHNAEPASLGAKVFQSLVLRPAQPGDLGTTSTSGALSTPPCPALKRFGLKYDRWLRSSEQFKLIPVFVSIIQSRQHSNCPLRSFRLWIPSNPEDPLELVEESQLSCKGLERLAMESGIRGRKPLHGNQGRQEDDRSLASEDGGPPGGQVKVREFLQDSDTARPSTRFSTLVGRAKQFVRRIIPGRNHGLVSSRVNGMVIV